MDKQALLVSTFFNDRVLAHKVLFAHRHKNSMTPAHDEAIEDWHSNDKYRLLLAFRGFAKSTLAEEAIVLQAAFREFKNGLIIGSNSDRAAERLSAIKHEIRNNEELNQVFGQLEGPVWGEDKIILSNGTQIQAIGKNQALRGVKYLDQRPDLWFADDLETRTDVRTPEGRDNIHKWIFSELIPACDPEARGRMAATPLDADALPMKLAKDPEWKTRVYPILYNDEFGKLSPLWPDRFPLEEVEKIRSSFLTQGLIREFNMEYLCDATSAADKPFKGDMFRVEAQVKTWHATYAMFDPARTKNENSASTGFACWSWIGNRLIVWEAWAKFLLPDEIINEVFLCNEAYSPTIIGVEEDGLNEFLMQPIRQEQAKRAIVLPVRPYRAPKGKMDFIRGLQPFFTAREIIFAKDLPDLKQQFMAFPTGRIDAPNALAYALKMRPGAPFYDNFGATHIAEDLRCSGSSQPWLCLNATNGLVTAVLVQVINGATRVFADWVREGDPGEVLHDIIKEANLEAGRTCRLICHPDHFDKFKNAGLVQAARGIPMEIRRGGPIDIGRNEVRKLLSQQLRGTSAILIDQDARWVLNGFAGGYCRQIDKQGLLTDNIETNHYSVIMQGLETFMALFKMGSPDEDGSDRNYSIAPNGQRYVSALAYRK